MPMLQCLSQSTVKDWYMIYVCCKICSLNRLLTCIYLSLSQSNIIELNNKIRKKCFHFLSNALYTEHLFNRHITLQTHLYDTIYCHIKFTMSQPVIELLFIYIMLTKELYNYFDLLGDGTLDFPDIQWMLYQCVTSLDTMAMSGILYNAICLP